MFYGRGAGGAPTASAVLGDIVAIARHRVAGSLGPGESTYARLDVLPVGEAVTRYYVNLDVADKPGVLATVASAFADNGVSIQNVRQDGRGDAARLVVRTHTAHDSALSATIDRLRSTDAVRAVVGVMRVEGEGGS
jgi:homoserine dehydrogenase